MHSTILHAKCIIRRTLCVDTGNMLAVCCIDHMRVMRTEIPCAPIQQDRRALRVRGEHRPLPSQSQERGDVFSTASEV